MTELTDDQQDYFNWLSKGYIPSKWLTLRDALSEEAKRDFKFFDEFLIDYGHPNPQDADRYLTVEKQTVLDILAYAKENNCLILQNCFGFDQKPDIDDIVDPRYPVPPHPAPVVRHELSRVGQVLLIQKGNFWMTDDRTAGDLFKENAVFKRNGKPELFRNMNVDDPLSVEQADDYIDNFQLMYPGRDQKTNSFIHGFLLPVQALINLFTDATRPLGQADLLTFRWGLTRYYKGDALGNFSLVIGIGDTTAGPVIEFRTDKISGAGISDCPPRFGCSNRG